MMLAGCYFVDDQSVTFLDFRRSPLYEHVSISALVISLSLVIFLLLALRLKVPFFLSLLGFDRDLRHFGFATCLGTLWQERACIYN